MQNIKFVLLGYVKNITAEVHVSSIKTARHDYVISKGDILSIPKLFIDKALCVNTVQTHFGKFGFLSMMFAI